MRCDTSCFAFQMGRSPSWAKCKPRVSVTDNNEYEDSNVKEVLEKTYRSSPPTSVLVCPWGLLKGTYTLFRLNVGSSSLPSLERKNSRMGLIKQMVTERVNQPFSTKKCAKLRAVIEKDRVYKELGDVKQWRVASWSWLSSKCQFKLRSCDWKQETVQWNSYS